MWNSEVKADLVLRSYKSAVGEDVRINKDFPSCIVVQVESLLDLKAGGMEA
jgi:hypothetical protein